MQRKGSPRALSGILCVTLRLVLIRSSTFGRGKIELLRGQLTNRQRPLNDLAFDLRILFV